MCIFNSYSFISIRKKPIKYISHPSALQQNLETWFSCPTTQRPRHEPFVCLLLWHRRRPPGRPGCAGLFAFTFRSPQMPCLWTYCSYFYSFPASSCTLVLATAVFLQLIIKPASPCDGPTFFLSLFIWNAEPGALEFTGQPHHTPSWKEIPREAETKYRTVENPTEDW